MKFVTFEVSSPFGRIQRIGLLNTNKVIDLVFAYALYLYEKKSCSRANEIAKEVIGEDMLSLIQGGELPREIAKVTLDFLKTKPKEPKGINEETIFYHQDKISLRAPIHPISIRDTLNSETHFRNSLKETNNEEIPKLFYERPFYYRTSSTSIAGPEDTIPWPSFGNRLDYELEFAVVIGKKGINIPAAKADEYIMGYTIFNDISIRDYQIKDLTTSLGPSKSKNFIHSNIIGPCIVTKDEVNPNALSMHARVNGEYWSESHSSDMYYSFPELIEFISKEETLYPGEIICSGTMANGCGLELGKFLKPGDMIELEVEKIGILRNTIVK